MAAAPKLSLVETSQTRDHAEVVRSIIQRQSQMEAKRVIFENQWKEVAERVLPREDIFFRNYANSVIQGEKRTEKIFDSTAQNALPRFAAAMESLLTPRTQRWHKLGPLKSSPVAQSQRVKVYFEDLTNTLFQARYSPRANFASQMYETYMGLGAFGNGAMFIDEAVGYNLRYRSVHMVELFFQESHVGVIDTVHRKFPMTARQLVQKQNENDAWTIPSNVLSAYEGTEKDREFDVLHCVYPRAEAKEWARKDYRGMSWVSLYIELQSKTVLKEGGYRTFPYAIGRYVTGPRETYGRGPAMQALPDTKTSQAVRKTLLRAGEMAVAPPILLQEDGILGAFDYRSNALNYGGLNEKGEPLARPFQSEANLPQGFDIEERVHKDINDAFAADLWRMLTEHPDMTATQALMVAQQQGMLYAPMMGRQQSETLGPMVEREIDLLAHAGQLPPMPPELIELGGLYDIEYTSPLNRMQRAADGVGIINTISALTPLANVDPTVLMIFDPEKTARELADINGVPDSVLRSEDEVAALKQQQQQTAAMQNLVQAAPAAANVAANLAKLGSQASNVPGVQPGVGPGPAAA